LGPWFFFFAGLFFSIRPLFPRFLPPSSPPGEKTPKPGPFFLPGKTSRRFPSVPRRQVFSGAFFAQKPRVWSGRRVFFFVPPMAESNKYFSPLLYFFEPPGPGDIFFPPNPKFAPLATTSPRALRLKTAGENITKGPVRRQKTAFLPSCSTGFFFFLCFCFFCFRKTWVPPSSPNISREKGQNSPGTTVPRPGGVENFCPGPSAFCFSQGPAGYIESVKTLCPWFTKFGFPFLGPNLFLPLSKPPQKKKI